MRMQKRQFRIGDLAKQLEVEKFVIRFWEKEFNVSTTRSEGGQRFYSEEDFDTFKHIKTLLYDEGFTIAGAKKHLSTTIQASHKTTMPDEPAIEHSFHTSSNMREQLQKLKDHLVKLQELL